MDYLIAFLWSLPWIIPPLVTYFRLRNSHSLDEERDIPPENPPLVSVILPARNEAQNIARCVSSILATTYPNLELIVVDDSSTDGTAEIARTADLVGNDGWPPTRHRLVDHEPPGFAGVGRQHERIRRNVGAWHL